MSERMLLAFLEARKQERRDFDKWFNWFFIPVLIVLTFMIPFTVYLITRGGG